jgi:molecular chaperone GrpE
MTRHDQPHSHLHRHGHGPHHPDAAPEGLRERLRALERERDHANRRIAAFQSKLAALGETQPEEENATEGGTESAAEDVTVETFDKVAREREEFLALARRVQAEFDNYRKRSRREFDQLKRESLAGFLRDFLAPFDDLDRVLLEAEKHPDPEAMKKGVALVRGNLWKAMEQAGVKEIPARGEVFNPERHEAMTTAPSADVPQGMVMEVFQNGYRIDDFVLRPARVVVSAGPPTP